MRKTLFPRRFSEKKRIWTGSMQGRAGWPNPPNFRPRFFSDPRASATGGCAPPRPTVRKICVICEICGQNSGFPHLPLEITILGVLARFALSEKSFWTGSTGWTGFSWVGRNPPGEPLFRDRGHLIRIFRQSPQKVKIPISCQNTKYSSKWPFWGLFSDLCTLGDCKK